jgi:hypothetical protein
VSEASATAGKRRCMTCHKDYDAGSAVIHTRPARFDDWCICQDCVDVCQKRTPPGKDKD